MFPIYFHCDWLPVWETCDNCDSNFKLAAQRWVHIFTNEFVMTIMLTFMLHSVNVIFEGLIPDLEYYCVWSSIWMNDSKSHDNLIGIEGPF